MAKSSKLEWKEVRVDGMLSMTKVDGAPLMTLLNEQGWKVGSTYPGVDVSSGEPKPCTYVAIYRELGSAKKLLSE